jgi:hypothetical protein
MSRSLSASSTASQTSNNSVPLTPLGQTITTPTKYVLQRFNSSSSMATSDDDDRTNPTDSFFDWPAQDDELLMSTYQSHIDNPTVAPFAGRLPPSGVIQRVAKDTNKRAKQMGRHFPHSLNATRKRLLLLCGRQHSDASIHGGLSDNESYPNSPIRFTHLHQDSPPRSSQPTTPLSMTTSSLGPSVGGSVDFDFFEPPQISFASHHRSDSPLERLSGGQTNSVSTWLFNTPSAASAANDIYPPTPASPLVGHDRKPFINPLASPFREKTQDLTHSIKLPPPISVGSVVDSPQSEVSADDSSTVNYTSERKRDSLKAKRGMKQKKVAN